MSHRISFYDPEADDWLEANASNCLSLRMRDEDTAELAVSLIFTNGHTCTILGSAARIAPGMFEHDGESGIYGEPCRLQVHVDDDELRLVDDSGACRQLSCGVRGHLDGITFPRDAREPGGVCELPERRNQDGAHEPT
jgi:hypothetical protein